ERLASAFRFLEVLEKMGARLVVKGSAPSRGAPLRMEITVAGTYTEELLARSVSTVRDEFKAEIDYSVLKGKAHAPLELRR
ncbi:MAG: hypothetical protein JRM82_05015, partial [Nitrososphaerota archaeon]|nr:hypothetical protein [Nitrososphaerota archaeon]